MKHAVTSFLLCALFVIGNQLRATTLPDACGDEKVKVDVAVQKPSSAPPAANATTATLVFVQRLGGSCIGCSVSRVGLDGTWIGANKGASFFSVTTAPGDHHVCALWEAPLAKIENRVGLTDFEALAGQIYYFETEITPRSTGEFALRMKPISADMGTFLVSRSKQSVAIPKPN
jgi:hypothetical protein